MTEIGRHTGAHRIMTNAKKWLRFGAVWVALVVIATYGFVEVKTAQISPTIGYIRELTEVEKYKVALFNEIYAQGLKYRDYQILREIVQCESSWRQFNAVGELLVSNGNVGLGQINTIAHKTTYSAMGLDVAKPFDNLKYVVLLYKKNGLRDWKTWSGHCWLPKIAKF